MAPEEYARKAAELRAQLQNAQGWDKRREDHSSEDKAACEAPGLIDKCAQSND
jgi:hypothetical protein